MEVEKLKPNAARPNKMVTAGANTDSEIRSTSEPDQNINAAELNVAIV